MKLKRTMLVLATAGLMLAGLPALKSVEAEAAFCHNDGSRFSEWRKVIKSEYKGQFKKSTLAKLDKVKYSTKVIRLDRGNKKSFKGTFESFYKRRSQGVAPIARKKIKQYKKYFDKAESQYGVPAELIAAIWGLETAFGTYKGKPLPILESVATLAYDCRRSESLFFPELIAALTIIDRGYIDLHTARGAWAGEIGQTQFLASRYLQAAVDYDGGGIDVFNSAPDVIGSTAKWFAVNGWQRGADYSEGTSNFRVIMKWNRATLYQKTIPKLAKEIRG